MDVFLAIIIWSIFSAYTAKIDGPSKVPWGTPEVSLIVKSRFYLRPSWNLKCNLWVIEYSKEFFLHFLACSSELQAQRSQPLKKKGKGSKSAKQRIVPLDPLDDVPLPKGFPDGPPPKPSDPLDNLFLEGINFSYK